MKLPFVYLVFALGVMAGCTNHQNTPQNTQHHLSAEAISENAQNAGVSVHILGVAQDAGFPQIGCEKEQCQKYWDGLVAKGRVSSIGLVDQSSNQYWIFDATPDFPSQLQDLKTQYPSSSLGGIFLTHAHIGHYTGLMYLGHEAMGAQEVPVYMMPKMRDFISTNGPWSQLVNYQNIHPQNLTADQAVSLGQKIEVIPLLVPHRDEYSETVGYKIIGPQKSLLFIPDINKWEVWDRSIIEEISKVDYALLDATFYDANELPGRNMADIPHPFVQESMQLFQNLSETERAKIIFIHFNHTNPLLLDSPEREHVIKQGFQVALEGLRLDL